jgi:MFS family permease
MTPWIVILLAGQSFGALANASSQAIWQAKVPPDMQGRVFSARRLIAWLMAPLTPAVGGILADFVFEPMMKGPNPPALFSALAGAGPGAGMGLMFVLMGLLTAVAPVLAFLFPAVRNVESLIPDAAAVKKTEEPRAETGPEGASTD